MHMAAVLVVARGIIPDLSEPFEFLLNNIKAVLQSYLADEEPRPLGPYSRPYGGPRGARGSL